MSSIFCLEKTGLDGGSSRAADELVHSRVPDRQDTNHLARIVDFINHPVHVAFRAVEQLAQPSFGFFALGCDGAATWQTLKSIDGLFEPVEPTGSRRRIVCRDSRIEVVEVLLGAERQFNEVRHGVGAIR